ncbi:MAG: DUF4059 family protein [Streptococcaceae bacterium]|nr:DUF4059 family protein [Streptococcaceae bacterium]MCL2858457.1 DUF4059 family protein [Streptococcaceae bacterium]
MDTMIISLYLKGLLFSILIVGGLSSLYLLSYFIRRTDKTQAEKRNRVIDVILINILVIPILSFAFLGIFIILRSRGL